MTKSTQVMASAWALKALRTELYASCSSWWIWVSISVSPYILGYGTEPTADLPFPATRPLGILFWCDGGRSSSVPANFFRMCHKIYLSGHISAGIQRNSQKKGLPEDFFFLFFVLMSLPEDDISSMEKYSDSIIASTESSKIASSKQKQPLLDKPIICRSLSGAE